MDRNEPQNTPPWRWLALAALLCCWPSVGMARQDPEALRRRVLNPAPVLTALYGLQQEDPGLASGDAGQKDAGEWKQETKAGGSEAKKSKANSSNHPKAKDNEESRFAVGLQGRFLFVPYGFLDLFLEAGRGLYSGSIGAEFIYRLETLDVVSSINFGFYSPPDGNFVGNNKPASDIDYVQFRDLNMLALDVTFLWKFEIKEWLNFVIGPGIGLGFVLGEVWRMDSHGCTMENANDLSVCNPARGKVDKENFNKDPEAWLEQHRQTCSGADCEWKEDDVWPVVPVIHLLLGLDFKVYRNFHIRVDGGFHNAFFFGTSGHYYF